MKEFTLVLSSPDGDLFRGEAVMLSLRGTEGELAIMAGHIPFLTAVVPCEGKILLADGSEKRMTLDGGLLNVSNDAVTLLSTAASFKDN